jgi:hypothetical protein
MRGWPSCNSPLTQRSEAFRRHIRVRFSLSRIGVGAKRVEEFCELRRTAVKPAAVHHIALAIAVIVLCGAQIVPASAQDPSTNQIINRSSPR